jgi:hypothetical protein
LGGFLGLSNRKKHLSYAHHLSRLDCYRLVIFKNGTAYYQAYGKHTGEEFYTEESDLNIICAASYEETH